MPATELLSEWEKTCRRDQYIPSDKGQGGFGQGGKYHTELGPSLTSKDYTLPNTAQKHDCAHWRINRGRYNPLWQMPIEYHPNAHEILSRQKCTVFSFSMVNRMPFPVRIYYLQSGGWVNSKKPMLQPGDSMLEGNAYLAENYTYKAVDKDMNTVMIFQVKHDGETIYIQPPPPPPLPEEAVATGEKKEKDQKWKWFVLVFILLIVVVIGFNSLRNR